MPKGRITGWATGSVTACGFGTRAGNSRSALIALVLAILAVVPAASAGESTPTPTREDGIVLFGIAPSKVAPFFQKTRCLVGPVRNVARTSGKLTASITYPSANFASDGRRTTVKYSHTTQILEPKHPEGKLNKIDLAQNALIVAATGKTRFMYRLVGVVDLRRNSEGLRWDFFADKPELWYRQEATTGQ